MAGDHFYTTDPAGEYAPVSGYIHEGTACYVVLSKNPNDAEYR